MKKGMLNRLSFKAKLIKMSLAMVIPVLFIGSFMVMLNGFPIQAYQDFLDSFLGGMPRTIIQIVQQTTVGILAVYITIALNFSYMTLSGEDHRLVFRFGSLLGCLNGFFILVGFFSGERDLSLLSGQGVFSAMVAGVFGSILFKKFEKMFNTRKMVFVDGADSEFNAALHVVLPFLCVTVTFAVINYIINISFDVQSVQHLFMKVMETIFLKMHRSYSSGLLFTTLTSTMWWFGIHGNNVLNQVAVDMFTEIIPGQIVSKSFMDTYVNMGGTGCTIGLLLAMILFGKRTSTKKLSRMAFLPGMFNIGELMVFGFPIIYNPLMMIPFILSPILCFSNAFVLTKLGILPMVTTEVVWTTPALLSGYLATGSVTGLLVQLMNIAISTACYAPFVVIHEKRALDEFASAMSALTGIVKKSEETEEKTVLTEYEGNIGRLSKHLTVDLEASLDSSVADSDENASENPVSVYYQPQYDGEGNRVGAESLLRWDHSRYGQVYPPLVIEIAKESGGLYELETFIFERAVHDSGSFRQKFGEKFRVNINVTISTLQDERFIPFLQSMAVKYRLRTGNICIEIKEESEIITTEKLGELIEKIRSYGYIFALEKFNMGNTSLNYLQHNKFDIVKLDDDLVRSILENDRTKEIINSIVFLSKSLEFEIIAQFVETEGQKEALSKIGNLMYQGYLFSPAVEKESFEKI